MSSFRWTSSVGLNSMYYDLKGATIVKTLQFRFQVMNLLAGGAGKCVHREFAAESYPDMDEWVHALQEVRTVLYCTHSGTLSQH